MADLIDINQEVVLPVIFGEGTDGKTPSAVFGPWFCDFHLVDGTVYWGRLTGYGEGGQSWVIDVSDPDDDDYSLRFGPEVTKTIEVPFEHLHAVVVS